MDRTGKRRRDIDGNGDRNTGHRRSASLSLLNNNFAPDNLFTELFPSPPEEVCWVQQGKRQMSLKEHTIGVISHEQCTSVERKREGKEKETEIETNRHANTQRRRRRHVLQRQQNWLERDRERDRERQRPRCGRSCRKS